MQWASSRNEGVDASAIMTDIDSVRRAAASLGGAAVVEELPSGRQGRYGRLGGGGRSGELEIMRRIKGNFDPSGV